MSNTKKAIWEIRTDFSSGGLDIKSMKKSPFSQFEVWMDATLKSGLAEPNAFTLATVSKGGQPNARVVLLRDFSPKGFSFFTNYQSAKGREMAAQKKVCMNFFWANVHRQIRIHGSIKKMPEKDSIAYFKSRPRESQLGAWASMQSGMIADRKALDLEYEVVKMLYAGKDVPKPPHWGGYLIVPTYFEFWQGRPDRLHDRIVFQKKSSGWKISRLNP